MFDARFKGKLNNIDTSTKVLLLNGSVVTEITLNPDGTFDQVISVDETKDWDLIITSDNRKDVVIPKPALFAH